jgi:putative endonuclease
MSRNQRVGRWGEHGYQIAARNVRTPYGEIDLIARKDGFTIFVEVKARTSRSFGPPELSVTPRKQAHMLSCAESYAQQNEIDHWQIDVIAVEKIAGNPRITHFENALS